MQDNYGVNEYRKLLALGVFKYGRTATNRRFLYFEGRCIGLPEETTATFKHRDVYDYFKKLVNSYITGESI